MKFLRAGSKLKKTIAFAAAAEKAGADSNIENSFLDKLTWLARPTLRLVSARPLGLEFLRHNALRAIPHAYVESQIAPKSWRLPSDLLGSFH